MTAQQRDLIRHARDLQARRRTRLIAECAECNCGYDERTPGCETCTRRHKQRRWKYNAAVSSAHADDARWHLLHDHELQGVLEQERARRARRQQVAA